MKKILLLLLNTCLLCEFCYSQMTEAKISDMHAIIKQEKNSISVTGKKSGLINFNFRKEITVQILDSAGLKKYSRYLFPESYDPTYIYHASEVRNPVNCFSKIKMISFDAKLKSKTGNEKKPQILITNNTIKSAVMNNLYGRYDQPQYVIQNLEIGDELTLVYEYYAPYRDNYEKLTSFRIFFNTSDLIEKYELEISYEKELNTTLKYYNSGDPDTSITSEGVVTLFWKKTNLAGCMDELGSRPYLSLPYLLFTIKPYELLYTLPYSFEEKFIPLYTLAVYNREQDFINILRAIDQGVKDKQYLLIEKFITEQSKDITNDTLGYQILVKLVNFISDEFIYDPDTAVFKGDDIRKERLGEYIEGKTIREISRFNLYAALISKAGLGYYSGYLVDKRVGEICNEFITPMFENDFLLVPVLKNQTVQLVIPKKSRFGYYISETPFYYENVKVRLVSLADYKDIKSPIFEGFRSMFTPSSNMEENDRKCNVKVDVDLDQLSASFFTKIILRGQYSTLCRPVYQYDICDNTINPMYCKKIYDFIPDVKLIKKEVNIAEKVFPFKTEVNLQYSSENLVKKISDGKYKIDLANLFQHIIYENFNSENRTLDFYADFVGKDMYTYFFTFNKNIEVTKAISKVDISNDFGDLIVDVDFSQTNQLRITTYFLVKSEKVPVAKIEQVKNIYDKIVELNNSSIEFKVIN